MASGRFWLAVRIRRGSMDVGGAGGAGEPGGPGACGGSGAGGGRGRRDGRGGAARAHRGMTMIELVVAITIVAIAASAVLGAMSTVVSRGANTMVRQQAVAIADAYLEEILLLPVTAPTLPAGYTAPTGQYARASWTYVDQYKNLNDSPPVDQYGNVLSNLSNYSVSVAVSQTTALTGITAANARRIDVTVTDPTGVKVMLSGYRANF